MMMQKPMIIKALKLSSVNVNMFTNVSGKNNDSYEQLKFITTGKLLLGFVMRL